MSWIFTLRITRSLRRESWDFIRHMSRVKECLIARRWESLISMLFSKQEDIRWSRIWMFWEKSWREIRTSMLLISQDWVRTMLNFWRISTSWLSRNIKSRLRFNRNKRQSITWEKLSMLVELKTPTVYRWVMKAINCSWNSKITMQRLRTWSTRRETSWTRISC